MRPDIRNGNESVKKSYSPDKVRVQEFNGANDKRKNQQMAEWGTPGLRPARGQKSPMKYELALRDFFHTNGFVTPGLATITD